MNKKIIFGLLLIGTIIWGLFFTQHLFAPAQIEPINLDEVIPIEEVKSKMITVRIDENDNLLVNEIKTDQKHVIPKLDSLNSLGFEKSKLILHTEGGASIEVMVKLMEKIQETGRKVIMSTK